MKLEVCTWPRQAIDPLRWGIFLMDVEGSTSSIYMMKYGAVIPMEEFPFQHDPACFPRMKEWQQAAALEVVYRFVKEGKVLGPFPGTTRFCPITAYPLCFYPSFVVPKSTPGSFRWVLNASYNKCGPSINERITTYTTSLIGVRESLVPGLRTRFMSRIDLKRAFKQLFRVISQLHLLATRIGDMVFIDATMSMGLKNTCKLFEEDFMKAFVKGLVHHHPHLFSDEFGPLVNNYLDDIWFLANTHKKNTLQLLVAEYWAKWLGIELNDDKRELPRSSTRHLGFRIDLQAKFVMISRKHKSKILVFFNNFAKSARQGRRIRVRGMQRMLGLQIWISTIFRIARQFLTSLCDALRTVLHSHNGKPREFFRPNSHKRLVKRVLFDLKFWRRFVQKTPKISFDYLLDRLPRNDSTMYSDASSSHGMGGVLLFAQANRSLHRIEGIFWQMTWHEWRKVAAMSNFRPGSVKITQAEFLAALITCETCADYCAGKLTTLALDNTGARSWFESARCPIHPLDRAAQGVGLYMLQRNMKVFACWISSQMNTIADVCSRKTFSTSRKRRTCVIAGATLRKVPPRWANIVKYF